MFNECCQCFFPEPPMKVDIRFLLQVCQEGGFEAREASLPRRKRV